MTTVLPSNQVFVQALHVRVRRGGIEIVIIFLDVLAMIAFRSSQPEQALLQNGIAAIPEREGKAKTLVIVGNAGDAVLGPAIGARAGMIMGEVIPSGPIRTVVLARISPRTFGEIRSPTLPMLVPAFRLQ